MTWVDAIVVLILACSGLLAFLRGFVREALGIGAWVGAVYVAMVMFSSFQPEVRRYIANPEIADPVAFGLIFLFALVAFSIIATLFARMVRLSALGSLDRMIGFLFGLVRGALVISAAYIVAGLLFAAAQWPDAVLEAKSLPFAYQGARWIADELPAAYTPKVDAPPPPPAAAGAGGRPPHGFGGDGRMPPADPDHLAPDAAPDAGSNADPAPGDVPNPTQAAPAPGAAKPGGN